MMKCTVFPTFRPFAVGTKLRKVLPLLALVLAACELPTDTSEGDWVEFKQMGGY